MNIICCRGAKRTSTEVIGTQSGCYSIKTYLNYVIEDSQSSCLKNCLRKSLKTGVLNLKIINNYGFDYGFDNNHYGFDNNSLGLLSNYFVNRSQI
ncbi:hypothetical protein BpHYR1_017531, partial [Brachionus plicatilis]